MQGVNKPSRAWPTADAHDGQRSKRRNSSGYAMRAIDRSLRPGLAEEMAGPPRFLGDPRERAPFSDPGGTACARPSRRRGAAFRHGQAVGSRDLNDFGAPWRGPLTRCLRFAAPVTRSPRKTRFRPLAKLCRAGLVTRRVPTKGFRCRFPLSQALPGALNSRRYTRRSIVDLT